RNPHFAHPTFLETLRILHQAYWSRVEQYYSTHQVTPFNSGGNSFRSDRRSSSSTRTRYSPVSFCSSASSASIQDWSSVTKADRNSLGGRCFSSNCTVYSSGEMPYRLASCVKRCSSSGVRSSNSVFWLSSQTVGILSGDNVLS